MTDMTRRRALAAAAGGALAATAGCLGFITGEDSLEWAADPAGIDESTLDETGYELEKVEDVTKEEEFEAGGESREVVVTNWVTYYSKSADMGPFGEQKVAQFVNVATPSVEIMGKSFNPLGDMDNEELAQEILTRTGKLEDVEVVGSETIEMLEQETEVTKFAANTEVGGMDMDVYIHLTMVDHDGDFIISAGVYPQELEGDEEEYTISMMENVAHPEEHLAESDAYEGEDESGNDGESAEQDQDEGDNSSESDGSDGNGE